ncbi:MAG: DJ-1/PfpI family protein [Caulobacteraceae bacterium]|nr:DJ-1/PfpI family protein [Caulobacter sp.]
MAPRDPPLKIGALLYEGVDQIDLTGPFEVLSRLPGASFTIYGVDPGPVRDVNGLRLAPDGVLEDAPQLDVLHVPGGSGQEALMDDARVLAWLRRQAQGAACVFSVCTGALLLGAAGLLRGRRATTYWAVHHLLPLYGAVAVDARVVADGRYLCAAGVTAGIDGALRLAADLRGVEAAQRIQLEMAYAPEPPFESGSPDDAPPTVLEAVRAAMADRTARRAAAARSFAASSA